MGVSGKLSNLHREKNNSNVQHSSERETEDGARICKRVSPPSAPSPVAAAARFRLASSLAVFTERNDDVDAELPTPEDDPLLSKSPRSSGFELKRFVESLKLVVGMLVEGVAKGVL